MTPRGVALRIAVSFERRTSAGGFVELALTINVLGVREDDRDVVAALKRHDSRFEIHSRRGLGSSGPQAIRVELGCRVNGLVVQCASAV